MSFKNRVFAVIFLIVACGVCVWFFPSQDYAYFPRSLQKARASERVVVGGVPYVVLDGTVTGRKNSEIGEARILRVAYAKALAERSPLIALAGTDPDELERALEELRTTQDRLSAIQESERDRMLVREGLYPILFLESLARLERARIAFVESGDEGDLARYQAALREAGDAYLNDITRFRMAFLMAVPREAPEFAGTDVVVSRSMVLEQLSRLESGMRVTRRNIAEREQCVAGIISSCSSSDIEPTEIPASNTPDDVPMSVIRDVRALFSSAANAPSIADGPVYRLSAPACDVAPGFAPALVPFEYRSPSDLPPYERIFDVRDIRFTPSESYAKLPFFAYFADQGVDYVHNPWFTYYKCLRLGSDYGTVFAMRHIRNIANDAPLSGRVPAPISGEIRTLERRLLGPVVEESDVREYLHTAQRISAGNPALLTESEAYEEAALMLKNRSAGFDRAVRLIAHTENISARLLERGLSVDLDASYLFLVRSGFYMLFLGDNPSVIGAQRIAMRSSADISPAVPFVFFSSHADNAELREKLSHDLAFDLSLHQNPGKTAASPDCGSCGR